MLTAQKEPLLTVWTAIRAVPSQEGCEAVTKSLAPGLLPDSPHAALSREGADAVSFTSSGPGQWLFSVGVGVGVSRSWGPALSGQASHSGGAASAGSRGHFRWLAALSPAPSSGRGHGGRQVVLLTRPEECPFLLGKPVNKPAPSTCARR